jgi:hypothetical protein
MSIFDDFRASADQRLTPYLATHGFRREPSLEEKGDLTFATVVYVGKHVGFIFAYDVRDDAVTDSVVRVENGAIKDDASQGGYSAGLFTHLVKHAGYRGHVRKPSPPGTSPMERELSNWIDILTAAGQTLLADRPDSLP